MALFTTTSAPDDLSIYSNESLGNATVAPGPGPKFTPAQWWFGQIFPWVIIIFGTFGNCAVIFVLSHQKYSKISTCFYMRALAFWDNIVMLLLFIRWLSRVPGKPIKMSTAFCVGYFFSVRIGFGMSAWALMFMTVDRFISVKWPLKAGELCTIKRAKISLVIIAIVQVLSHLPYLWRYYDANPITLTGQCPYNLPQSFNIAYKFLRMLVFDRLLPWVLTLGFTVAMSIELYRDLKRSRETLGEDSSKLKQKLSRRVTAMSLIVSWTFFFLTFPTSIDYGIRVTEYFHGDLLSVSAFLYDLWVYFLYLNSALNFWLYICASGKFRQDFKMMTLALFGRQIKRTTTKGSLSYGTSSTSRKASDGRVSGIGHVSPNHVVQSPVTNGQTKSPLPTINGSTEYHNPEFTHL